VGVFLEDYTRHSYSFRQLAQYEGADSEGYLHQLNQQDEHQRSESIEKFQQQCRNANLAFSIHRDRNVALQELLEESIYADLLIINAAESLTRFKERPPTKFIQELLAEVQCPVVLVPETFQPLERILLLYDGEPSSVFAARSFSYLFDCFAGVETSVLTVRSGKEELGLPRNYLVREFIKRHFPKAEYIVIKGNPEEEIPYYLQREKKAAMVVLGAYQRSRLSRMFKPSMADHLLKQVKVPLFIAHNKS
jgi:nucleotide-binding universal stress UspA family protein